ncbi:hypothetical protein A2960_04575 [Candidatus Gottesmanbacteria bacterium RIFCSPLOWO2_01_FULL_39_12b]|uniref:Uncharacterized protein n=1 Tax=Candidatus Gottesmanbacteria bacterium RIFCSPLOWO2_01_FULL_39_12b TaxID=1798388 RepID=A0A1F6AP20_9BACT|nr:MAG: hypothetical protein A2960_04575 [Candidatus Gottesmanbacteria bacterium RIFCSPLOWO2_01_FULL_39_12b]
MSELLPKEKIARMTMNSLSLPERFFSENENFNSVVTTFFFASLIKMKKNKPMKEGITAI